MLLAIARYGATEDRVQAREYLARAGEMGDSLERCALALFDAICADDRESAPRLAFEAAEGFKRFRTPLLEAAAREIAGDLDSALALYRRCSAAYHVRRLEGTRPTGSDALASHDSPEFSEFSAREREIVVLAANGESNLEIARSLSISHKTVEKHLGAAYQKLGVSSRRQLRSYVK